MIGKLKPIKLLRYYNIIDINGDATESMQSTKMWAQVEDGGGGRTQENGKTELSDSKTFKVYFRGYNITPDMKIQYFGQTYAISNARRINEMRFNWEITAFALFEMTTGSAPAPTVDNWTNIQYNQVLGGLVLEGGTIDDNRTVIELFEYPYTGFNYLNAYGEAINTSPFLGSTAFPQGDTKFTPGQVLIRWRRVTPDPPFTPLTTYQEQVLTITRLSRRYITVMRNYGNFGQLPQNAFPFRAYDVQNNYLGIANNANEYIQLMNSSAANQLCFTVVGDASDLGGMKFYVDPIAPYQSWNFGPPLYFYAGQL